MEPASDRGAMLDALAQGDHASARVRAKALLRGASSADDREVAQRVLVQTRPDPFLSYVGLLGLGLIAWLVYNYAW